MKLMVENAFLMFSFISDRTYSAGYLNRIESYSWTYEF